MNYITTFKEALSTFWHNKSLWIFGILLTIFGQGEYNFGVNYRESYPMGQDGAPNFPTMPGSDLLIKVLDNPIPYLIGFSILSLVIWIFLSLICWWSQSTLIIMVDKIDQKDSISAKNAWIAGKQKAIPLTIIAIIFNLPTAILNLPAIAGGIWLFSQFIDFYKEMLLGKTPNPAEIQAVFEPLTKNILLAFACIFPIICFGGILGWLLSLVNKVTARSFVLENLTIIDSVKRGWKITRRKFGYIFLNGIVLTVISSIFGVIAAVPALVILVPVAQAFLHQNWTITTIIGAIILGFYFLFVATGLGGIFTSFNSTLWTKLFKAIIENENINISESTTN